MSRTLAQYNARNFLLDTAGLDRIAHKYFITLDNTSEEIFYTPVIYMPQQFSGGDIIVNMFMSFASEVTPADTAVVGVSWQAITLNSDSFPTVFATEQTTTVIPDTAAGSIVTASITFTNAQADDVQSGDIFQLKIRRVSTNGSDTAIGDLRCYLLEVKE